MLNFDYKALVDISKAQPEIVIFNRTTWDDAPRGGDDVPATATATIPDIQTGGRNLGFQLLDPATNKTIELGSYQKKVTDTNPAILASSIAAALNLNIFGYRLTSQDNVITVTAKAGVGAAINGHDLVPVGGTYPEQPAQAYIGGGFTPDVVGGTYDVIVDFPGLGAVTIYTYTQQPGDTSSTMMRDNAVAGINAGVSQFKATAYGSFQMYLIAKPGFGASINGNTAQVRHNSSSAIGTFANGRDGQNVLDVVITPFAGGQTAGQGDPMTNDLQFFFTLTTPSGIVLLDDSAPAITGLDWTSYTLPVIVPQINGHMEWGGYGYILSGYAQPLNGTATLPISLAAALSRPTGNAANQQDNYGAMKLDAQVQCEAAEMYVQEKTDYTYLGFPPAAYASMRLRMLRPLANTDDQPTFFERTTAFSQLGIPLLKDGTYTLLAEAVTEYKLNDRLNVRIKYQYRNSFEVNCYVDLLGILKGAEKFADDVRCRKAVGEETKLALINTDLSLLLLVRSQPLLGWKQHPILKRIQKALGAYYVPCDCETGLHSTLTIDNP